MATSTIIGQGTFVRGRVSGSGDLEIAGHVEGDVSCSGEVVVEAGGLVAANISAARIVVRGAVRGDLVAGESLVIESAGRVVGDLRAPRIAIVQGGLVRGHVQTASASGARPRVVAAQARAAEPQQRPVLTAVRSPASAPVKVVSAAPVKVVSPAPAPAPKERTNPKPVAVMGARSGPPAPVVPVLKKGTKAIQKKRGG